jgi:hypothetical protein
MKKPRVMWGCLIPLVGLILLPFVGYFLREFRTSAGRKALPAEATHVQEHLTHGVIPADFTRLLKASMPVERYSDYARALGLTAQYDPKVNERIEATLNMKIGYAPAWWDPPKVDSTAYFAHQEGDDHVRVLRYHNGTVYLLEISW